MRFAKSLIRARRSASIFAARSARARASARRRSSTAWSTGAASAWPNHCRAQRTASPMFPFVCR
jgi:hypothetical protein